MNRGIDCSASTQVRVLVYGRRPDEELHFESRPPRSLQRRAFCMRYTYSLSFCLLLISAMAATASDAAPLTIERIFSAPDLGGPRLREAKFSPDGRYVTFL